MPRNLFNTFQSLTKNPLQLKAKSNQTTSLASPDESPKESPKEGSDEETPTTESRRSTDSLEETRSVPTEPQQIDVVEGTAGEEPNIPSEIPSEAHADQGEDGWQPVQRPRSAGSSGRRLKQRRATIGKVYTYQKKHVESDSDYPPVNNNHQNARYYVLKKRTVAHGSYADYHTTNASHVAKFGRRIVKALTYRVKSVPSSTKTDTAETSGSGSQPVSSPLEPGQHASVKDIGPQKNPIVSIGNSPSYKEVAIAPPGSIAKMNIGVSQNDDTDNFEQVVGKHEEETSEARGNDEPIITGVEDILGEEDKSSSLKSTDHLEEETEVVEKKEEGHSTNATDENPSLVVFESLDGLGSSGVGVPDVVVEDNILTNAVQDSYDSPKKGPVEKDSSGTFELHGNSKSAFQEVEDLKDKSLIVNSGDTRALANKKLSASAAPFNPSPTIARPAPVSMNITLPVGPGAVPAIAPWPVNMNIHPGPTSVLPTVSPMCSSPHHPYPSPPATPNMIQPLPFMYPPYTQPQAVPTSSAFHPNHFAWQCNVNPNVPEFVPGTVWPGCHPVEFTTPPPVINPMADSVLEQKLQSDDSSPTLPVDIENVGEMKTEVKPLALGAISHANEVGGVGPESVKENGTSNLDGAENAGNESYNIDHGNAGSSNERIDCEKTFSILIRGRRNRKQTLRMPISLLNRPYGSQSFKVIHNRVVRGNDAHKSTSFSSREDLTASAT